MDELEAQQVQYASFVVRLWRSSAALPEESSSGWQGELEHIQSGRRTAVASLGELCELLGESLKVGEN